MEAYFLLVLMRMEVLQPRSSRLEIFGISPRVWHTTSRVWMMRTNIYLPLMMVTLRRLGELSPFRHNV